MIWYTNNMSDVQPSYEVEINPSQIIIFTDLDGTLLDHTTYDHSLAQPALERTKEANIPVIPVTSKTWPEVQRIQEKIEAMQRMPAIVENGGGIIIPKEFISIVPEGVIENVRIVDDGTNWVVEIARPIEEARKALSEASQGISIESFGDMAPEQFSKITGLSVENSVLALQRQFQEGFRLVNPPTDPVELQSIKDKISLSLKEKGFNLTFGGRFWQVTGEADKGKAVEGLKKILGIKYGKIHTIGLGDASGDIPSLVHCDEGYIVANPHKIEEFDISLYPHITKIVQPGPSGWNQAINTSLDKLLTK